MKYYIQLHTRRGNPMGIIYWNNKKELIEEAKEQMERLTKSCLKKYYLHINNWKDEK